VVGSLEDSFKLSLNGNGRQALQIQIKKKLRHGVFSRDLNGMKSLVTIT